MSVYVGIDVHRKRSQVAVVNEGGEVLANRNVPNGVRPILSVIGELPAGTPAAFEAAHGWGWLLEVLEGYGFEPHMVHPLQCKAIASARLKNDKVDAATLAQLLRADLLPEAWTAPLEVRQMPGCASGPGPTRGSRCSPSCPAWGRSPRWCCSPRPATSPASARRASWQPGRGSPRRCAARIARSATGTSPSRGRRGRGGCCARPRRQPGGTRTSPRLRGPRPPPRQEDRHHRDRPQAPYPRLPPAHRRCPRR